MHDHEYAIDLAWEGNTGEGTASYAAYGRQFRATSAKKPALVGSADPTFRGDPTRHNPEDLLVVSVASCHMLSYLALCARKRIRVLAYRDAARGRMVTTKDGGGHFEEIVLRPRVTIARGDDLEAARELHHGAHETCFIASSVNFSIRVEAIVEHGDAPPAMAPRQDLAVRLPDRPGALAELGEALARAGISIEGGGGFGGVVHFLVANARAAAEALHGVDVLAVRDVVTVRLDQETPGQLGKLARAMAEAGVNIECIYSDHDHQLVVVADDVAAAARVAAAWGKA